MKNIFTKKPFYIVKFLSIIMLFVLMAGIGFSFQRKDFITAAAETFIEHNVDNGKFSMKMTINARKSTTLQQDKRIVTNVLGEDITYFCFKWSELESLKFRFNANIKGSTTSYKTYKFLMTNIQTEDLKTAVGVNDPKTLYQGNISSNTFSQFDFYYYVDKNIDISETATRSKGNDFGIYKFDFVYTYLQDSSEISVSIGEVYVAVIPEDVEKVPQTDMRILYSISSSNRLMNVFNLYLSSDAYKYVNPKYLQWIVVGVDKQNVPYILTQKMKDENINYANHRVVWQTLNSTTGTSFVFDSNDIEGVWTATCSIKNKSGGEKVNLQVSNLSTIKQQEKSNVWWILMTLGIVILIAGGIAFIIFYKKRDKVW